MSAIKDMASTLMLGAEILPHFCLNPFRTRAVPGYATANLPTAPDIQVSYHGTSSSNIYVIIPFHINWRWISSLLLHFWGRDLNWVVVEVISSHPKQQHSFIYWSRNGIVIIATAAAAALLQEEGRRGIIMFVTHHIMSLWNVFIDNWY